MVRTLARKIRTTLCVVAVLAVPFGTTAASPAGASMRGTDRPIIRFVAGGFTSPALTVSDVVVDGSTARINVSGADHWSGALEGTTTYSGSGTVDLVTGEVNLTVLETFTGSLRGVGSGHLYSIDKLTTDPTQVADCLVVGGDGDLAGVHGFVHFEATKVTNPDPFGNGDSTGYYVGLLLVPHHPWSS